MEGCRSFTLNKIVTPKNEYYKPSRKLLKFTPDLISDIHNDMKDFEDLKLEMQIGDETVKAGFTDGNVSISTLKNIELEYEITSEINEQFNKKYTRICPQFLHRVYNH